MNIYVYDEHTPVQAKKQAGRESFSEIFSGLQDFIIHFLRIEAWHGLFLTACFQSSAQVTW